MTLPDKAPAAATRLEPQTAVVVYDRADGRIVAAHLFSAAADADLPGADELYAHALATAAADQRLDAAGLAATVVEPAMLGRRTAFRIDPGSGALEALPANEEVPTAL